MTDEHFRSLPPLARAEAMDRPYRTGRRSWLIAAMATVLANLLFFGYLSRGPDAPAQNLPAPTEPARPAAAPPAEKTGVVYQNLRAPVQPRQQESGSGSAERPR